MIVLLHYLMYSINHQFWCGILYFLVAWDCHLYWRPDSKFRYIQGTFFQRLQLPLDQISGVLRRYDLLVQLRPATWPFFECPPAQFHSHVLFSDLKSLQFSLFILLPLKRIFIILFWSNVLQFVQGKHQFFCFSHCSFNHGCINGFAVRELNTNSVCILFKSNWRFLVLISMVSLS